MSIAPPTRAVNRRPRREDVRLALLEAAAQVFARRGIEAGSMEEVAAVAGFTKGAVYSNFASKDDLVAALVDDRVEAHIRLGLASSDDPDATLAERARALGDRISSSLDEQRDWHLLVFELWARAVRRGAPDERFLSRRRELRTALSEILTTQAEQSGQPLPLPASEVASLIIALANGLAVERRVDPDAVPDHLLGQALALLMGPGASTRPG